MRCRRPNSHDHGPATARTRVVPRAGGRGPAGAVVTRAARDHDAVARRITTATDFPPSDPGLVTDPVVVAPTPAAPARARRSRAITILSAALLLAFAGFLVRLHTAEPRLAGVAEPERALALLVGRTMDVETALTAAPGWERRLYALTLGDSGREIDQAIAWYEELADYSLAPEVDLRLAVLRGEAGQLDALRRAVSEWETRGEPLSSYAAVLAAVYLDADEVDPEDVGAALETLGPGWFADALALRLSVRFDEPGLGEAARRSIASRAGPLLWKLRALTAFDVALVVAGLLALRALRRRPPQARAVAAAPLPPPWPFGAGLAALVRGGAISALALVALLAGDPWLAQRPLLAEALDAPILYLPVVLLAWRTLVVRANVYPPPSPSLTRSGFARVRVAGSRCCWRRRP